MEDFIDRQKMKKLGSAEEIAAAATFLASSEVHIDFLRELIYFEKYWHNNFDLSIAYTH